MTIDYHSIVANWLGFNPLIIDNETTGLGNTAETVELAVINSEGEVLFRSLIRPCTSISPFATRIHGLTNDHVARAPTAPKVWPTLWNLFHNRHIIAYNVAFDVGVLQQTARVWNLRPLELGPTHCAMQLFAAYYADIHSWTSKCFQPLGRAVEHFGIETKNTHRALADAEATRQVLYALLATERIIK